MGQAAVAHTVLNRVKSTHFKNTICEVVYRPRQFTDVEAARPDYQSREWETAVEVAVFSYIGFIDDPTEGALWFYAHDKVEPVWAQDYKVAMVISGHTFLRKSNEQGITQVGN